MQPNMLSMWFWSGGCPSSTIHLGAGVILGGDSLRWSRAALRKTRVPCQCKQKNGPLSGDWGVTLMQTCKRVTFMLPDVLHIVYTADYRVYCTHTLFVTVACCHCKMKRVAPNAFLLLLHTTVLRDARHVSDRLLHPPNRVSFTLMGRIS